MDLQLTPLAVALQGIGYGTFLTAVHGLAAQEDTTQPPVVTLLPTHAAARPRPRRRAQRIWPVQPSKTPAAVTPEAEDEELTLSLLGMV